MNRRAKRSRPLRGCYKGLYAPLWASIQRIARMLGIAMTPLANELRRLNGIGAAAGSRGERVRTVKQALARRGDGPNRCC